MILNEAGAEAVEEVFAGSPARHDAAVRSYLGFLPNGVQAEYSYLRGRLVPVWVLALRDYHTAKALSLPALLEVVVVFWSKTSAEHSENQDFSWFNFCRSWPTGSILLVCVMG